MAGMLSVLALAAAALAVCRAGSDVLDLTDADFKEKVAEHDIVLVEFFAPWCGHCKKLAPEYEKAATKLVKNDPPVALAKVDCTAEKATCDGHGVSGFPTLKIFRGGEMSGDYDGPREADGIVKYMRGQVGPSSKEISTLADMEKFLSSDEHGVVGLFKDDSKLKDSFQKVADTERDRFRFAHTSAKEVLDKYGKTDDIVIFAPKRLHNKFEENEVVYDGLYDTDKIKNFLTKNMHGLGGHRTPDNTWQFAERPLVVVYYNIDYVKDPKGSNYWRNRVLKVAEGYKRKVHFAVSSKDDFGQEVEENGLTQRATGQSPVVAALTNDGKFPMQTEFSVDNLKAFVEEMLAGKLEPYFKSEPVPENNDGPVKVVVAKNFKEIVNQDKDVLIEFYAPWCGHCKKLTPIFDELGEKLKDEDVVIAKMDATANDVPPLFSVSGFPTLYWSPKGKKDSPRPYSGGRELNDFIKYIAKESTDGLKGYDKNGKKKKKEL